MHRPMRRLPLLRHWLVPVALVLLLLAQSLALVHGVLHARPAAAASLATVAAATSGSNLFGDHTTTDCRLFDQAAPTDLAPVPVPALSFALDTTPPVAAPQAVPLVARLRAFRARDPPLSLA